MSRTPPINDKNETIEIPRRGSYVSVIDTCDEWEDLVGIVEEYYDEVGNPCGPEGEIDKIEIRIPLAEKEQRKYHLEEVNELTPFVRKELRMNNGVYLFQVKKLEPFDESEL